MVSDGGADADRLWTHLSSAQAAGLACVMCEEPAMSPGWRGQPVGVSARGARVVACEGACAEMATMTSPDGPESP